MSTEGPRRGRAAQRNPTSRFERLTLAPDPDEPPDSSSEDPTEVYLDTARSVLTTNDSPDIPVRVTLNAYRGCEHGCIYCYARPYHEYLGLSAGLDFERKLFVKMDAAAVLREELTKKSWGPDVISLSGVTDPYQPVERRLRVTRACLEVLAECRNPVAIITKSHLVTRDIDLLQSLAAHQAALVLLSVTTLDDELAGVMEPRAARPARRLDAIRQLREAGVPVGVMVAPIIPGLTDHEVPAILAAAADAGATTAARTVVRLPHGLKDLFADWLETHLPLRKERVLNRLRDVRGGKLNDARFGTRMAGEGPIAEAIHQMFTLHVRKYGLTEHIQLSTSAFRRPRGAQGELFG